MKQSEADIQRQIIEALLYDGWLLIRVNHGQRQEAGARSWEINWQMLGMEKTQAGIADVIAVKSQLTGIDGDFIELPTILAIEVKAPGKAEKLKYALRAIGTDENVLFTQLEKREQNQARFIWAIRDHGGIGIVADSLEDLKPYLDRVEVQ